MKHNLKIKWNNELALTILFFGPQVNYYIACLLSLNGMSTITTYVYAVLYAVGLLSYMVTLRRKAAFFSFATIVLVATFSYLFNAKTHEFMFGSSFFSSSFPVLMLVYFPMFLLMLGEIDFDKLMRYMKKLSIVTLVLAIISFYAYIFIYRSSPTDYMSFAYMMLTPTLICFMYGWNKNQIPFILCIIAAFINFIVGCRGSVITIAVFLILYIIGFYMGDNNKRSNYGLRIAMLVVIGLIAINADRILQLIALGLQGVGFTSRTVSKLLRGNGAFVESEGRWAIWKQAFENMDFLGKGLFGDRTVILDEYGHATYAHNFALEIVLDFGILIGFILVILFLLYIIRSTKIAKQANNPLLLKMTFAMICIFLAKHMISTSYLISFDFWFYLGLMANIVMYRGLAKSESYNSREIKEKRLYS